MSSFVITKSIEDLAQDILKHMMKRHYSKYGVMSLFSSFEKYPKDDFLKALAFLCTEKFIAHIDKEKHVSLQYFQLLDESGKPIKDTMINDAWNSDTFGQLFYRPEKETTCFKHLEESVNQSALIVDLDCQDCFKSEAERICLDHNQSLIFCQACRHAGALNKKLAVKIGKNNFIDEKIAKHNKSYWGI